MHQLIKELTVSIPESSQGNEYNINMWVYVNDYVYRKDEDKCILYKGDVVGALNNAEVENNVNTKCNPCLVIKEC